jgi:CRP-like cAMP-binding protein
MGQDATDAGIMNRRLEFLKGVGIFTGLSDADLRFLAENLVSRKYRKMEIIFHQGDDSQTLYLIVKGKVRIYSLNPGGEETSYRIFAEKDVIGEFAAIDGKPRSTTAKAVEDCVLIELERSMFTKCLREMPELSMGLIRHLVNKLRWTTEYAETIARYDTKGRLLHIILQYKDLFGKEIEPGMVYEYQLYMNQEDLASMIGARREWVNRILQQWRKDGLLEASHGNIKILDLPAVEKERNRRMDMSDEDGEW